MGKKKSLPKNFSEIVASKQIDEIYGVFKTCDVNATGGYGKQTAASFDLIPDEVLKWLVDNGADLSISDTWGNTPLHIRARSRRSSIKTLLDLGANPNVKNSMGWTPLHEAAGFQNVKNTQLLIEHGALVNEKNYANLIPLEVGLRTCENANIKHAVLLSKVLLEAGSFKTPLMNSLVMNIGKTFEFHRERFNKDSVDATSNALNELYQIYGVKPIEKKKKHSVNEKIEINAIAWQEVHEELWNLLVPSSGHAFTLQGEAIRITGRILNEIEGNGGINWDSDYKKMVKMLLFIFSSGNILESVELKEARDIIKDLNKGLGDTHRLAELAVIWVKNNLDPIKMKEPEYRR